MASLIIAGDTSGTVTLQAPAAVGGSPVLTLPTTNGTLITTASGQTLTSPTITGAVMSSMASSVITSGTVQASTSGTSIDFTSIPSWVKRITVMFSAVSTNGTSPVIIQLGAGSIQITGYVSAGGFTSGIAATAGAVTASDSRNGSIIFSLINTNSWVASGGILINASDYGGVAGAVTLSGTLDRLRITTVSGTNTFDAGSINILYE